MNKKYSVVLSLPLTREVDFAKQKTEGEKKKNTSKLLFSLPQFRYRSTAFGPGRKYNLLHALAKNMPPAYFLTRRALIRGSPGL